VVEAVDRGVAMTVDDLAKGWARREEDEAQ
jgi:hypothetical protein